MCASEVLTGVLLASLALGASPSALRQQGATKEHLPGALKAESTPVENDRAALQELALQTWATALAEVQKVEDIRERVRLMSRAMGSIWKRDEPRARSILREIFATIDRYQPTGKSPQEIRWIQDRMRQEAIQEVTRHDPGFASELAQSVAKKVDAKDPNDQQTSPTASQDSLRGRFERANRLANLALETLQENPERSAKLAEESMVEGVVSSGLFYLFIPLRMSLGSPRSNPVFERALALLVHNPSLTTLQLQALAVYIFPDLQLGRPSSDDAPEPTVSLTVIQIFLDLALRIIARSTDLAGIKPPAPIRHPGVQRVMHAYFMARQLRPKFERYGTAEALVALNSIIQQMSQALAPEQLLMVEANAEPQTSVAKLFDLAEKEPRTGQRDKYYAQAALSAFATGDYHNALKIAERMDDRELRREVEQQIKRLLIYASVERGAFDEAVKWARELGQPADRATMLILIARALAKNREEWPRANLLLWEAEQAALKLEDSVEKAQLTILLAETANSIDSPRSFEILSVTIKNMNAAFDAKGMPRFLTTSNAQPNNPPPPSEIQATQIWSLDSLLQEMARRDLSRTIAIVLGLSRIELRLSAELSACGAVLRSLAAASER